MTKYEKVKTALQMCRWEREEYEGYWPKEFYHEEEGNMQSGLFVCVNCPYDKGGDYNECLDELHKDALELLEDMNERLVRTTTLFRQANARNCALLDKLVELERQGQEW